MEKKEERKRNMEFCSQKEKLSENKQTNKQTFAWKLLNLVGGKIELDQTLELADFWWNHNDGIGPKVEFL
jgi:hypothetical protein